MSDADYAHPDKRTKTILYPYRDMYQSLENFSNFVNQRKDLNAEEKNQVIAKRNRYVQLKAKLEKAFTKLLNPQEMQKYPWC